MRRLAVLLVGIAVFAAGCGGGGSDRLSKAEFEQHMKDDGQAVQKAVSKISAGQTSLPDLADKVHGAEIAVQGAADDLDGVKPPQDAEQPTKTIVRALRAIDEQLKKLEQAAKDNNPVAAQSAASAIQHSPEVAAAQKAANELKRKGYEIGVLGT